MANARKIVINTYAGSEPVLEMEDCTAAVGADLEFDDFGEVIELCDRSPMGQCEYSWRDKWHACIHCGKPSGLDE